MLGTKTEYDIIIVGAGPAGSTAGYLLANFGYNVIIIDKANFPRPKLCGGLLTLKTLNLNERVFHETKQHLIDKGVLNYIAYTYEMRSTKKRIAKNNHPTELYFVQRNTYDMYFLHMAEKAGANILEGDKVVKCDIEHKRVITKNGKQFTGKYIVAADGVHSLIRNRFPAYLFDKKRWKRNLSVCAQVSIGRKDLPDSKFGKNLDRAILFILYLNFGYAWVFPNKDEVVYGVGGLYQANKYTLISSLKQLLKICGIDNPNLYKTKAHSLPTGYYLNTPVFNNVVLTGDAGGYVDPRLGEGIFYAQRTAELASWAIHWDMSEEKPLEKTYTEQLSRYVLPELKKARTMRDMNNLMVRYHLRSLLHFRTKWMYTLFGRRINDMIHGERSSLFFRGASIHERIDVV